MSLTDRLDRLGKLKEALGLATSTADGQPVTVSQPSGDDGWLEAIRDGLARINRGTQ